MLNNILGPDAFEWMGAWYRLLLSSEDSDGAISVLDCLSPGHAGPPRHIHHDADETFLILSGEVEFWLDGKSFRRGPGETVFIPRGRPHTFRVATAEPSRFLVTLTPGGFEEFVVEMAHGHTRIPEDMETVDAAAARFQLSIVGPPLGMEVHA